MGQPIKLIIKKGEVHKDGTNLIYVQYCFSSQKRVLLSTDISIPAKYWDKKKGSILTSLPPEYGESQSLEADLREKHRRAEQLVDYALHDNTNPVHFLKRHFKEGSIQYPHPIDYANNSLEMIHQIDLWINGKISLIKEPSIKTLHQMKNHIKAYQRYKKIKITFDSIGLDFYQKLVKFLTYDIQYSDAINLPGALELIPLEKPLNISNLSWRIAWQERSYPIWI
jgi:hypothetical protein